MLCGHRLEVAQEAKGGIGETKKKGGAGVARTSTTYKQTIKAMESLQGKSERVIKRLLSDARARAPGWVAAEVTKVYNIKKSEITPAKAGKAKKNAGSVRVNGETVDGLELVYRGRVLSPAHFGMTPKAPKATYTLKAEIIKGQKVVLGKKKKLTKKQRAALGKNFRREGTQNSDHSPIMLMPTGAGSAEGTQFIPFQRKSADRKDIKAIKTVSLPQMVSSERTSENINQAINENLQKRMAQHMKILEK